MRKKAYQVDGRYSRSQIEHYWPTMCEHGNSVANHKILEEASYLDCGVLGQDPILQDSRQLDFECAIRGSENGPGFLQIANLAVIILVPLRVPSLRDGDPPLHPTYPCKRRDLEILATVITPRKMKSRLMPFS